MTSSLSDLPVRLDLTDQHFFVRYKKMLDSVTHERYNFLSEYLLRYKLSDDFRNYAKYEISGSYLALLELAIFYKKDNLKWPKNYFKELEEKLFSWDEVKNSRFFSVTVNYL